MAQVRIRHGDGREFGIDEGAFDTAEMTRDPSDGQMKSYKDAGFKIVGRLGEGGAVEPTKEEQKRIDDEAEARTRVAHADTREEQEAAMAAIVGQEQAPRTSRQRERQS